MQYVSASLCTNASVSLCIFLSLPLALCIFSLLQRRLHAGLHAHAGLHTPRVANASKAHRQLSLARGRRTRRRLAQQSEDTV